VLARDRRQHFDGAPRRLAAAGGDVDQARTRLPSLSQTVPGLAWRSARR
jgi:hypothetical protein